MKLTDEQKDRIVEAALAYVKWWHEPPTVQPRDVPPVVADLVSAVRAAEPKRYRVRLAAGTLNYTESSYSVPCTPLGGSEVLIDGVLSVEEVRP